MSSLSWWRSWHDAPTDKKWATVAARAGTKPGVVSAIAWAMMDYASQHQPRGTIEGFDTEDYAVYSGFTEDEIKAVMKAMDDKGITKDGKFVNWDKRQPKREDDSAERVRKFREMKRSVTHGNVNGSTETPQRKSTDTDNRLTDTEKDRDDETLALDPFDALQRTAESKGIILSGEADIKVVNELLEIGATPDDLLAGIEWKSANNNGKAIRYMSQLIGPTKTALAKRLQASANGSMNGEFTVGAGGRVSL